MTVIFTVLCHIHPVSAIPSLNPGTQCFVLDVFILLSYPQFDSAISAIEKKYSEVERALIEEFVRAHRSDDLARMKDIAEILSHFKG